MPAPKDPLKYDAWIRHLSESKKGKRCGKNSKMYGVPKTEEAKRKMSLAKKGKKPRLGCHQSVETRAKISAALKGRSPPNMGKTHSEETRRKIGLKSKGRIDGPKNPNWNNGSSFEPYCPKFNETFKKRVRAFFSFKCVECGKHQTKPALQVHHVNFDKKVCCNNNLPLFVPLCNRCHTKTNFNREYWETHFTEIIMKEYNGKCYLSTEEYV